MKRKYEIKSERGNYLHRFIEQPNGLYRFETAEPWMVISISGNVKDDDFFFDPTEGPVLYKGWSDGKIRIAHITEEYLIMLEEC